MPNNSTITETQFNHSNNSFWEKKIQISLMAITYVIPDESTCQEINLNKFQTTFFLYFLRLTGGIIWNCTKLVLKSSFTLNAPQGCLLDQFVVFTPTQDGADKLRKLFTAVEAMQCHCRSEQV